jgi:hypothetical protein
MIRYLPPTLSRFILSISQLVMVSKVLRLIVRWRVAVRDIKESIQPMPNPPGFGTTLRHPTTYEYWIWEQMHPDDVKYAFKRAVLHVLNDYKQLFVELSTVVGLRGTTKPPETPKTLQETGAGVSTERIADAGRQRPEIRVQPAGGPKPPVMDIDSIPAHVRQAVDAFGECLSECLKDRLLIHEGLSLQVILAQLLSCVHCSAPDVVKIRFQLILRRAIRCSMHLLLCPNEATI